MCPESSSESSPEHCPDSGSELCAEGQAPRRKPPVFLIGTPRSGTTLLHQILEHHPAFAIPYESKYLAIFRRHLDEFGDLRDPKNRETLIISIERFMRNAWLDRDLKEWIPGLLESVAEVARDAEPTYEGVLEAMYSFHARRQGRPRWADKMATFRRVMPTILDLFPDARIIHIIRDGRDVASSLLRLSFGPNTAYVAAKRWTGFVQHGLDFAEKHPRSVYTLRYEDLIDEPERVIRELCDFVGEPFCEAMLQFHESGNAAVPRKEIHHQLNKPLNRERVARWKRDLSRYQVRVFEAVAGPLLARLGYEVVNPDARISALDRWLGHTGNKLLWWRPFTRPVGLRDRLRMSMLRSRLKHEE